MARNGTPRNEDALVIQLASGATNAEAAKACGMSLRTVARRLEDADFRQRIVEAKTAFTNTALDRLLSLRMKHVTYLDKLAKPTGRTKESGNVRLGASKAIIELGSRLRVETEFEERLRAIEERLNKQERGEA